jgi:hypothetical protein
MGGMDLRDGTSTIPYHQELDDAKRASPNSQEITLCAVTAQIDF